VARETERDLPRKKKLKKNNGQMELFIREREREAAFHHIVLSVDFTHNNKRLRHSSRRRRNEEKKEGERSGWWCREVRFAAGTRTYSSSSEDKSKISLPLARVLCVSVCVGPNAGGRRRKKKRNDQ
jgi:hypothetical protein